MIKTKKNILLQIISYMNIPSDDTAIPVGPAKFPNERSEERRVGKEC